MNNRTLNHERLTDRFYSIFDNHSTTVYLNTCTQAALIYTMSNGIFNFALPHGQKLACPHLVQQVDVPSFPARSTPAIFSIHDYPQL